MHDVINGLESGEEFAKLLTGEAATNAMLPLMLRRFPQNEGAKVKLTEILLAKIESRMVVKSCSVALWLM